MSKKGEIIGYSLKIKMSSYKKSICAIKFSGKKSYWDGWLKKFLAKAKFKGYCKLLLGKKNNVGYNKVPMASKINGD